MDSLSHALLGAVIGQAGPAQRAGNRALIAGALIAWLPDIDVVIGPWLNDATALTFHRGITHSILFIACLAPLLGALLHRLWPEQSVTRRRWILLAGSVLASHLILDSFTSYGIQLLLPFSDRSFAIASISVIDPLYSLPLLLTMLMVPWLARDTAWRPGLALAGLMLSSAYLALTLYHQQQATTQIRTGLAAAGIPVERLFVKPTMFNNVLWRGIAESGDGYYVGFHSRRDQQPPDDFIYFPRNADLLGPYRNEAVVRDLIRVSEGYFQLAVGSLSAADSTLTANQESLFFHDLRYGQAFEWLRDDRPHVFTYRLIPRQDQPMEIEAIGLRHDPEKDKQAFEALLERVRGYR